MVEGREVEGRLAEGPVRLQGRLLVEGELRGGALTIEGTRIARVELDERLDGPVIAPGFVDLHLHGFGGCNPLVDLAGMARALARFGTTSFQPTLFPAEPTALGECCAALELAASKLPRGLARVVGIHLEGPFVNPEMAGALPKHDLHAPSVEGLRAILGPATGSGRMVRTLTVAPELAGAFDLIAECTKSGVRVSLGHSKSDAATARKAAKHGATGATHLFNAMGPIHHREIGLAGMALTDAALHAEIIGDLMHVGGDAIDLALKARTPRGLCLVSDALQGAGTGCDHFHANGRDHVIRDGAAYYPSAVAGDPPKLAGSALSQLEMVRRLVSRGFVSLADALTMASTTPADALGLACGRIAVGAPADLVVLSAQDLALEAVYVGGVRGA
jgi:N-acetylglucosamine-6-phosphate deacetylase